MPGLYHSESLSPGSSLLDDHWNPNAYDQNLYGPYYRAEDDYYAAYADLLEYEEALRFASDLSEAERLRRWRDRLAFEELAEAERTRRYELMAEEERLRLGLIGKAWWARRYGSRHHGRHTPTILGGWRDHYGDRLRRWTANRLPLSSSLASRFERMWHHPGSAIGTAGHRRRLSSIGARPEVVLNASLNANLQALTTEQVRLTEQLRAVREEARIRELELERTRRRLETEFAIEQERELERQRAEAVYLVQKARHEQQEREILERNRIEQERYREELIRWENDRTRVEVERKRLENEQLRQEVASNMQSREHERRLRRELDLAGKGLYF